MANIESIGVVVATYGDMDHWAPFAYKARMSAENQTTSPKDVVWVHGESLTWARNYGAEMMDTEWLIFLDADDTLDYKYIESMSKSDPVFDLHQPSTLGVVMPEGTEDDFPVLIKPSLGGMLVGNHLVIGTMVRKSLFHQVGGFRELPILEDWDLWIRCFIEKAAATTCPAAVYRVTVNQGSRNKQPDLHSRIYVEIQKTYAGLL